MKYNYKVVPFPQKNEEPKEGFRGQFSNLKLSDIIQLCTQGKMSLIIHISQNEKDGKIYMHEGEIIHAVHKKKTGIEAFYEIMSWKNGNFRSEDYVPPPIQSITLPWEHLLIEAHRWMDEKEAQLASQQKAKVLFLENNSKETLENIYSWANSHSDIDEMGIFSNSGVRTIFHRGPEATSGEANELIHAIPETARYLGIATGAGTCEEVIITGNKGSFIIFFLNEDAQLFVLTRAESTQMALLRMELKAFVKEVKKGIG